MTARRRGVHATIAAVRYALHLQARSVQVAADLERAMNAPGEELAPAALAIARDRVPGARLERLPRRASIGWATKRPARVAPAGARGQDAIRVLNEYLYDEQRFTGNRERYDDPRNSFLNEVLDRRTGIPISLAVVYLEIARRAGVAVDGINFPGHFLLRASDERRAAAPAAARCDRRSLPRRRAAVGGRLPRDAAAARRRGGGVRHATCSQPATRHEIVVRMLVNLKRLYVRMRSFPQARFVADLLLTVDPSAVSELRDRGLLAYHLQDFGAALRDLESYLRLLPRQPKSRPAWI